jgi:hypothetical protein
MRVRSLAAASTLTFGSLLLALTINATGWERQGPTVQVSVQATDSSSGTLTYCWRSTDGVIQPTNSKTTSWTLPAGRGIHFAYVQVTNSSSGGVTERRIAINTDRFGGDRDDDDDDVAPPASACVANLNSGIPGPTISDMTASLNGHLLPSRIAQFQPPSAIHLPSDVEPRTDAFLSALGLDNYASTCNYYQAVGAAKCINGELVQPITYREWRRAVEIGRFATPGAETFRAAFVNKVDLNLARVHESISYGPTKTAAVVCNHLGTKDFFNPTQDEINDAVLNAVENRNLVACVAMDYMINPAVDPNTPFVRFLIFGPSGALLPSVNLDGRGEKFVPGTCVACHGGDSSPNQGQAKIDAHFLPYDVGNFEFAKGVHGLGKCDQQDAIYHLNQNVLNTGPTPAAKALIGQTGVSGWYAKPNNGACSPHVKHVLDEGYVPPAWQTLQTQNPTAKDVYTNVVARSCRTCHVAQPSFNWDADPGLGGPVPFLCGNGSPTMPNSLVTFNRFWLTNNSVNPAIPDQVHLLQKFLGVTLVPDSTCPALKEVTAHPTP